MFRKNYLPKGDIYKCSSSCKYFFAYLDKTTGLYHKLLSSDVSFLVGPDVGVYKVYYADSIEDILGALYRFSYERHLEDLHRDITYSKGIRV